MLFLRLPPVLGYRAEAGTRAFGGTFPTRQMLDTVAPDIPVVLTSKCGHATWVNTKALQLAGVDRDTPVPDGGNILKDDDGEPTGIFQDRASALVRKFIPAATPDETYKAAVDTFPSYGRWGSPVFTLQIRWISSA